MCTSKVGLLLVLVVTLDISSGANILFFFGLSTYSHRITAWPLAVKLAEKGHHVTFLQSVANKDPHPKVTDMVPKGVEHPIPPNFVELRAKYGKLVISTMTWMLPTLGVTMCKQLLNHTDNLKWINKAKFDLVIMDALFNDCGYGLAWKWNAKTIVFGTTHAFDWFPDSFGFPDESSSVSGIHFVEDLPLTFFGRVKSALSYLYFYLSKECRAVAGIDGPLREKLDMPDMPPVSELIRNTSLIFINTHFSEELARSLPPLVVPIGGMHVSEQVKHLPKEFDEFAKGSFIYVSFGSEADLGKAPNEIRQIFFNALGRSEVRFLMRWNGERPKEMPDNVLTAKWMPQQDILGHANCIGFITHGGLLSMHEAVHHGVPMIVFPIFAEQDYNAERLHRTGRGIRLDIGSLTQPQLEDAINRLLNDPKLKHEMRQASRRFKDRPAKPVETAVWWVEYVMRYQDTSFLRPLAISLTWYQRRQLDVWAFLSITLFILTYVQGKLLFKILRFCCSSSESKMKVVLDKKKK